MALTTFDRELYEQGIREEGEAQGEGNLSKLIKILLDEGLDDVEKAGESPPLRENLKKRRIFFRLFFL